MGATRPDREHRVGAVLSGARVALRRGALLSALTLAGFGASTERAMPGEHRSCASCSESVRSEPEGAPRLPAAPADTFSHPIHKRLACLTCHLSRTGQKLTFEPPRGCTLCHHESPERKRCAECHTEEALREALEVQVSVTVPDHAARTRPVGFRHELHDEKECLDCHTTPVSLLPADSVKSCAACHADHHARDRDCAACHRTEAITKPHEEFDVAHLTCDRCHTRERIAALEPTRSFCLACHDPEEDHNKERECSECHFLLTPAEFRARLASLPGGGP